MRAIAYTLLLAWLSCVRAVLMPAAKSHVTVHGLGYIDLERNRAQIHEQRHSEDQDDDDEDGLKDGGKEDDDDDDDDDDDEDDDDDDDDDKEKDDDDDDGDDDADDKEEGKRKDEGEKEREGEGKGKGEGNNDEEKVGDKELEANEERHQDRGHTVMEMSRKQEKALWRRRDVNGFRTNKHVSFLNWRSKHMGFLSSRQLVRAPPAFFASMLRRELIAADRFGDNDGCVSIEEHPNMQTFLRFVGGSTDRICRNHIRLYLQSSAFTRDVANVKAGHEGLLELAHELKIEENDIIASEMANISGEVPPTVLSKMPVNETDIGEDTDTGEDTSDSLSESPPFPDSTDSDNETEEISESEIKRAEHDIEETLAQLESQQEGIAEMTDTEFAIDEGLLPRPPDNETDGDDDVEDFYDSLSKEELMVVDAVKLRRMDMRMLQKIHPPPRVSAGSESDDGLAYKSRMMRTEKLQTDHVKSKTRAHFKVHGPCPMLDGGKCVGSPNYPFKYGSNQWCWIAPTSNMRLRVEAFDLKPRSSWMYVHPTYYTGRRGPQGFRVSPRHWIAWNSLASKTGGSWKICKRDAIKASNVASCLYGRNDLCPLKLSDVTLLGSHNSGAYRRLYLECGRRKQQCQHWLTSHSSKCRRKVKRCTRWGKKAVQKCSQWGPKCTKWADRNCGWFDWLCGLFCQDGEVECEETALLTQAKCLEQGYLCKEDKRYFTTYVGCSEFTPVCQATTKVPAIRCFWETQHHGFRGQLSRGVRYFDIDSCLVSLQIKFCHGHGENRGLGSSVFAEIEYVEAWLQKNQEEVVMIYWNDWDHGVAGMDYPSDWEGDEFHRTWREICIHWFFDKYAGSPCIEKICYTTDNSMKLELMIEHNVRLVTYGSGVLESPNNLFIDSFTPATVNVEADSLMTHLSDFCDGGDTSNMLPTNSVAGLTSYVDIFSTLTHSFEDRGTYRLKCPNNCEHPFDDEPRCKCRAGKAAKQRRTCTVTGMANDEPIDRNSPSCAKTHAKKINTAAQKQLETIVGKCLARNTSVQVLKLDWVRCRRRKTMRAVHGAIDQAVAKHGATGDAPKLVCGNYTNGRCERKYKKAKKKGNVPSFCENCGKKWDFRRKCKTCCEECSFPQGTEVVGNEEIVCGRQKSDECKREYRTALNNGDLQPFCVRCLLENDSFRSQCKLCCRECNR